MSGSLDAARNAPEARDRAQRGRGRAAGGADRRLPAVAGAPQEHARGAGVGRARRARGVSRRADADGDVPQPADAAVGRRRPPTSRAGCGACRATEFQVFAVNCAHLGCPVRWFPQSSLFMCPCHGGAYYADGSRASGPPPRGLFHYDFKVENDRLFIQAGMMPTLGNVLTAGAPEAGRRAVRLIRATLDWLDARLQVGAAIRETAAHPVPRRSASWWYVFGSGAFTLFLLQIVTGICLALVYVPSAGEAFHSLQRPELRAAARLVPARDARLGLELHGRDRPDPHDPGVPLRRVQVPARADLDGRRGPARRDARHGLHRPGAALRPGRVLGARHRARRSSGAIPLVGGQLVQVVLGGPIIAGETLTRFFALHVFVIPGLLIGLVGVHLLMVLKLGINEYPMPGRVVNRDTYEAEYEELVHKDGVPFVPVAFQKDLVVRRASCSSRSCSAPPSSARSGPAARRIPRSSRRSRGRTTSSSGSSRSPR